MENALDELEKAEKNHTEVHRFSDSYRQKQTALLDSICAAEENDERMMFEIEKKNMDGKENKNQIKSAKQPQQGLLLVRAKQKQPAER